MKYVEAPNIIFEICFCDSKTDIDIYNKYYFEQLAYRFCNAIDSNIPIDSLKLGWMKIAQVGGIVQILLRDITIRVNGSKLVENGIVLMQMEHYM